MQIGRRSELQDISVGDGSVRPGVDDDDCDRGSVELDGRQDADREDLVDLAKDDAGRCRPESDRLGQHGGAGGRATSRRHHEDAFGHDGAELRVADLDDPAGRGVESSPQAERLIEDERLAFGDAFDEEPAVHRSAQSVSSRTTRPAAAERTHSSRLPIATSTPRLLGAYQAHLPESVITGPSTSLSTGVTYVHVSVTIVTPD